MPHVPAPAVELTIRVRYPLSKLTPMHREFGIDTLEELVAQEVESMASDPAELVELLESGRSSVEVEYELDAAGHEFEGGELERDPFGRPLAPRDFHGLGEA